MERHRCKLCFRNFANGRALGGHMRSHMMKLYAAQKASNQVEKQQPLDQNPQESDDDFQSLHSYSTTSSDEEDEEFDEVKGLSSVVLQDTESETESFKNNPVCRRSKRVRKSGFLQVNGYSSLSSISDTTPEEHVAHCLIMLSRDKWKRDEQKKNIIEDDYDYDYDYSEDSGVVKLINKSTSTKVRGKYRCETCNKLFKSYQALGGHRASHKKIKLNDSGGCSTAAAPAPAPAVEKVHECPFCHRVFTSGQALGGHKRSHFINGGGANIIINKENSRIGESLNIDLNLPAPVDDDEIAVSAVSDALD